MVTTRVGTVSFLLLLNDKTRLDRRPIYEYQCDVRLKAKTEGPTRLGYNGFSEGLEPLKIETRLINERFVSVIRECVNL